MSLYRKQLPDLKKHGAITAQKLSCSGCVPSDQSSLSISTLILRVECQLEDLQRCRCYKPEYTIRLLRRKLKSLKIYKSLHPPIHAIPPEILSHICTFAVGANRIGASVDPTQLEAALFGSVCRYWRQVALTTPHIWATLNIYISSLSTTYSCDVLSLLKAYLDRPRDVPLFVELELDSDPVEDNGLLTDEDLDEGFLPNALMKALLSQSDRIYQLVLKSEHTYEHLLPLLFGCRTWTQLSHFHLPVYGRIRDILDLLSRNYFPLSFPFYNFMMLRW
uniref:Uncharacterized protein n=1 Tax=Moniliophthora roreri TaxID=221103 RepID=A0A0W0FP75_MONRR